MYVDASTANQIAHDYQEITKDSALLIARLIKKLRSNNAIPKKKSHLVEIKVDNELVYKGETGKQPQVNKLTSDQLQMLSSIIGSASAKEVFVSVDGEPVYHSKSGFEKVNQLSSQLQPSGAVPSQLLQLQDANSEQEVRNLQVVVAAKRILNTLETNEYESEKHHLKRDGSNIIVSSFDGQLEIARSQGGLLTGSASEKDILLLSELDTKLNKEKAVEKSVNSLPASVNSGNVSQEIEVE